MASALASEAERLLNPFWQGNRTLYGDQMARTLVTRSHISVSLGAPSREAQDLAQRALEAVQDSTIKEEIQSHI